MWTSLSPAGFLVCILLLDVISSAPLPAGFPVMNKASSLIIEVKDRKTNVTLSFTVSIMAQKDEGSRTRGRGGSDDSNSSSSSEEVTDVGLDPDSDESLESIIAKVQPGTSRNSIKKIIDHTASPILDLISPDPNSNKVKDTSRKSTQKDVNADMDPAVTIVRDTLSIKAGMSSSVSFYPDSSEENQNVVGSLRTSSPVPVSRDGHPELSSSSEEIFMVHVSPSSPPAIPSPQTPAESGSSDTDSGSDLDSQSTEPVPGSVPTFAPDLSPEPSFNSSSSSEVSQKVSVDDSSAASRGANPTVDYSTITVSIAASPEASIDTQLERGVKETDLKANDVSIEADPSTAAKPRTSLPSLHVSSGACTEASKEPKVDEVDDATTLEATTGSTVSFKPTTISEYSPNPAEPRVSTDAITDAETQQTGPDGSTRTNPNANSSGAKQIDRSEHSMASPLPHNPPGRKKLYRFGSLGPISHSFSSQKTERSASDHTNVREALAVLQTPLNHNHQNIFFSRQANRKQTRVSVAAKVSK